MIDNVSKMVVINKKKQGESVCVYINWSFPITKIAVEIK